MFSIPTRLLRRHPRLLAIGLAAMAVLLAAPLPARSEPSATQRVQFLAAWAAAKLGGNQWRVLAKGLHDYPLYLYLPAAALEHDVHTLKTPQVKAYLARYPDTIPAEKLRRAYLGELATRGDWKDFAALYRPGLGDALACDALRGRLAAGKKLHFDRDLASLWRDTSLPSDCDPVLDWAHKHGLLTHHRIWQRIERAAQHGPASTIKQLARWLPKSQARAVQRLAMARHEPYHALREAVHWHDSSRTRRALTLALVREGRANAPRADREWRSLRKHFKFSAHQRHRIEATIALYRATDFPSGGLKRLAALPRAAQTDATYAWRVRLALAGGDWHQVKAALDAMPKDQRQDETWRYWRARTEQELGHHHAAHALFAELARNADYYGFLAADWINMPYAICPSSLDTDATAEKRVLQTPGLERAFEFFALHLLPPARREWDRAQSHLSAAQRRLAADAAFRVGWFDRAIVTFASGSGKHLYRWRFPLARKQQMVKASATANIDPAWAFAITRAESAFKPDAHSGANARGLMQLLPSTARHVARKHGLTYHQGSDLYDPDINIPLGTQYLGDLAAKFNGAPYLASAAYNAGPDAVSGWVAARGKLAPDAFVSTIPYQQTRVYVRRVMAYSVIYDWRLHGAALPIGARMPRIGEAYVPPNPRSRRKRVACPVPSTSAVAASAPATPASVVAG